MNTREIPTTKLPAWLTAGDKFGTIVLCGQPYRVNRDQAEMLLERVAIALEADDVTLEDAERTAAQTLAGTAP